MAKISQTFMIVGGVLVIAIIAVAAWLVLKPADKEVDLALGIVGTSCTVTTPVAQKDVEGVQKNGKVIWNIRNYCPTDQVVSVGNFRSATATTKTNCNDSIEGSVTWPFHANDETLAKRSVTAQGSTTNPPPAKIELHDARNDGTTPVTYYFSVCIGSTLVDPRLVIEP